ncbi:MAG TPA: hypothetical protein VGR51_09555 [Thermoplasmata archaeon]|jgi:hypothetical protein|nr:hypothetical protein [Thermoplasmata archaeon]
MPPKDDSRKLVLLIVAVVVIVVVISLVMAAVLYVMVSGLIGPGSDVPLSFSQPVSCGAGCTEFFATGSVSASRLTDYTVAFTVNGGTPTTVPLADGVLYDANGITLTFTDVNGDGRLSPGDSFRVQNSGTSASCELQIRRPGEDTGIGWSC